MRWGTDYFIKCDVGPKGAVVQVGLGEQDHKFWRRPEDMTEARPAAVCGPSAPASDVAGMMAAALAAASVAFRQNGDAAYADKCLSSAKNLYRCAAC